MPPKSLHVAKYRPIRYDIHMGDQKNLGIIVSNDWKHRFLIIKGVVPNSIAYRLGIMRNDRIVMVDSSCGDAKLLTAKMKVKKDYVLTTLRAIESHNAGRLMVTPLKKKPSKPSPVANETYNVNKQQRETFRIHCDSSDEDEDDEHSESFWQLTPTCTSVRDHFDRQRAQQVRCKLAMSTPISLVGHYFPKEEIDEAEEFENELRERGLTRQQLLANQANQANAASNYDRVASWVAQQPTPKFVEQTEHLCAGGLHQAFDGLPPMSDESAQANKENFMPVHPAIWTLNPTDIKCCPMERSAFTKQSDNIVQPRCQAAEKKRRVFASLNNVPRMQTFQ